MAFYSEQDLLRDAEKKGYAVPGFFPFNLDFIKIIIEVAEEENSPVIFCQGPEFIESFGDKVFTQALITAAQYAKVPVSLSVDHAFKTSEKTVDEAIKAIHLGWKSFMLDGSTLNYEENVRLTKKVADICRPAGIASVGALGEVRRFFPEASDFSGEFYKDFKVPEALMTDPDEAAKFVNETGIDTLAVSVGQYIRSLWDGEKPPFEKTCRLNLERLKEIRDKTDAHLILMGGTHVKEEDLRASIDCGVSMIKVASEQALIWANEIRTQVTEHPDVNFPEDIQRPALLAVKESMRNYIRLFNSNGKAEKFEREGNK